MLAEIHQAMRTLLYQQGQINPAEVDVRFDIPTREWIARLTHPTVSFFLYGVTENVSLRVSTFDSTRENGRSERRLAPRRIDLYYLVTALATDVDDEHRLLWRALATLMRFNELPASVLPDEIRELEPPFATRVGQAEGAKPLDVWSALNVEPHASIGYIVTAPLDLNIALQAPLVLTRTAQYLRVQDPALASESAIHIGGVVRKKNGTPVAGARVLLEGSAADGAITSQDGAYRLAGVSEGKIRLRIIPPDGKESVTDLDVPSDTYDITVK